MLGKFRAWAEVDEDDDEGDSRSYDNDQQLEDHPQNQDDEGVYNPMDDPDLQSCLSRLNFEHDNFLLPRYPGRTTSNATAEGSSQAEAGPGPQTAAHRLSQSAASYHVLDDCSENRVVTHTEDAGIVRRKVSPPTLQFESTDTNGDTAMRGPDEQPPSQSPFFPFTSELDWKVAQWVIKEDPGQNALDRLLSVPGVRST